MMKHLLAPLRARCTRPGRLQLARDARLGQIFRQPAPAGLPFFKVVSGLGGPALAVKKPDGKWTPPHVMKPLGPNDPPLSTTPGLTNLVESAHRVDDYVFLEFKPDAKVHGDPVPSKFFLLPGGFAYQVEPSAR